MEGECKVVLDDSTLDTEARTRTLQGFKPGSKLTTALLLFTLCLAAAAALLVLNKPAKSLEKDEENIGIHHTLRQLSNVRAAIHLKGEHNPQRKDSVEWKNQVDQSYAQGGLKLEDNEIVIPKSGLYFVYSQTSFRVNCSRNADDDDDEDENDTTAIPMVHLSHTVQHTSGAFGSTPRYHTILHSVRTACQKTESSLSDEKGKWFSAIYMGAVFNLKQHDRLRTRMEEGMLSDLDEEPGNNFFGVFAL